MIRIKTFCDWCGSVDLAPEEVTVRLCTADLSVSHVFRCPACRRGVGRPVDPSVILRLLDAACRLELWALPAELSETKSGDPIDYDDALVLHELLATQDWLDSLMQL